MIKNALDGILLEKIMGKIQPDRKDLSPTKNNQNPYSNDAFIELSYRYFEKTGKIIPWDNIFLQRNYTNSIFVFISKYSK